MDEDSCISPTDASQWMYDRARGQQSISSFIANNSDIEEEDENSGKLEVNYFYSCHIKLKA